jgi:hypothetical protein
MTLFLGENGVYGGAPRRHKPPIFLKVPLSPRPEMRSIAGRGLLLVNADFVNTKQNA